ncbi:hypothetical protein Zmor_006213 [Zophobas morio]|uniref:Uncharacterized protein n=1 Tax=Zophobas morio TaxID=2755281 RepID=A0AA38IUI2_9CUCU|nr:hypothetical protein Zmor_006213 [Zophobas morio]
MSVSTGSIPASQIQPPQNHRHLWKELITESENKRNAAEEYRRTQMPILEPPPHPAIDYLNDTLFPVLNAGLIKMLHKIKEQENQIFTEGDTYLNTVNFIAEFLWNMNPNHPERKENWSDISSIIWN